MIDTPRQKCEGCGAQVENLSYTTDDVGLCDDCLAEVPVDASAPQPRNWRNVYIIDEDEEY